MGRSRGSVLTPRDPAARRSTTGAPADHPSGAPPPFGSRPARARRPATRRCERRPPPTESEGPRESDRNQILHEHAPEHFESRHGAGFTLVEATVFPGRSREAKRLLFAAIARNLAAAAGVDPAKLLIVLHEPPLECWGVRGGKPASEVSLGFKLDV
jgi:phenylpyruvate tautomerase PptA (4-oxalocrotonate tautomerase family)